MRYWYLITLDMIMSHTPDVAHEHNETELNSGADP